jgi:hypothetical protein
VAAGADEHLAVEHKALDVTCPSNVHVSGAPSCRGLSAAAPGTKYLSKSIHGGSKAAPE